MVKDGIKNSWLNLVLMLSFLAQTQLMISSYIIQWWPPWPLPCKTLNIYLKCCSKCKSRDSFKICSSWGFQNTPYMFKLIEFWLRYLRSKTNDMILKISSKLIEIDENLLKSIHFVSKVINSTSKASHWPLKNDFYWNWCHQK